MIYVLILNTILSIAMLVLLLYTREEERKSITERFNENRKKASIVHPTKDKKYIKKIFDKLNESM